MKQRLTLFTFLALFVVFTHCTAARGVSVWGQDGEELSAELRAGNYNALHHISFDTHRLQEVERLGEDAPYAVGLIYLELGMPDVARELLRLAWEEGPDRYRREALVELAALLTESEEFEELASLGEQALEADVEPLLARSLIVRAHYEQERWNQVVDSVDPLVVAAREELPHHSLLRQEALLWRAISQARLDEDGFDLSARGDDDRPAWVQEIVTLFADYPATVMHARVWLFLLFSDAHRGAFSESELRHFQAKQLLAEGKLEEATEAFGEVAAERNGRDILLLPYGVFDYFRAAAATGSVALQLQAARELTSLSEDVDREITARTLEYAGRLYRATGRFGEAIRTLEQALEAVEPGTSDQRIQWYLLSARVRQNPELAADNVSVLVAELEDPAYFADVLAELGERLIADAAWPSLLQAYQGIEDFATPGTLARYQLVLGRVYEQGMLPATTSRARQLRTNYLELAAAQSEDRFSAMIAGTLLGIEAVEALGITSGTTPDRDDETGSADALAHTYLAYGLRDRLLSHIAGSAGAVSPAVALEAAQELNRDGAYRSSVVALNYYEAAGGAFDRQAAEIRYPRAFAALVDQAAQQEGVDPWVLYALAREESLFDPDVVSVAGAVGLTQLLPTTAEDIARRMRLEHDPVLTDPADNIAIGARYFAMLTDQFGTSARAIAAYNGGQGNVRRWERTAPMLDELLFHQLIPFEETYNHVRKVVVSAAYYGYLYDDRTPAETVAMIFDLSLD